MRCLRPLLFLAPPDSLMRVRWMPRRLCVALVCVVTSAVVPAVMHGQPAGRPPLPCGCRYDLPPHAPILSIRQMADGCSGRRCPLHTRTTGSFRSSATTIRSCCAACWSRMPRSHEWRRAAWLRFLENRHLVRELHGYGDDRAAWGGAAPTRLRSGRAHCHGRRCATGVDRSRASDRCRAVRRGSTQDARDATAVIATLTQSGLSLPDRDYYLKADDRSRQLREAYLGHLTTMFTLVGDAPDRAAAQAKAILTIETRLAPGLPDAGGDA